MVDLDVKDGAQNEEEEDLDGEEGDGNDIDKEGAQDGNEEKEVGKEDTDGEVTGNDDDENSGSTGELQRGDNDAKPTIWAKSLEFFDHLVLVLDGV